MGTTFVGSSGVKSLSVLAGDLSVIVCGEISVVALVA